MGDSSERSIGRGVTLRTELAGFGASSTRAEFAAGIIAAASDLPVHVGSDSQGFISKARRIKELARGKKMPRRPWNIQKDRDLWECMYNKLISKGVSSFKLSEVKGHGTERSVQAGDVPRHE